MESLGVFIIFPAGALLIAAAFAWASARKRSRLAAIAALLWAAYGIYESLMYARILCTGECNIRIDLLLIHPLLLGITLAAVLVLLRARR